MRVFVTGASGHIGSAVVPELLGHGHTVVGLARSDAAAEALTRAGAEVVRGTLDDLDLLRDTAAASEGVIHLAFKHEAMQAGDFMAAIDSDLAAITALLDGLEGTGKPFVGTSGTLMLTFGGIAGTGTETDVIESGPRVDAENAVIAAARNGVRSSVIRLPPTVHSSLDHHGYVPLLIGIAREKGKAGFPGDGANRWPAGHTLDAARLYRLALESAPAGTRLHAVGDEGVPFATIAEEIGRGAGVPVAAIPAEEMDDYYGFLSFFVGLDNPTSAAITTELLGWKPEHPGLVEDLREGHYFAV